MIEKFESFNETMQSHNGKKVNEDVNLDELREDLMKRFSGCTNSYQAKEKCVDEVMSYAEHLQNDGCVELDFNRCGLFWLPDLTDLFGDVELTIFANYNELKSVPFISGYKKLTGLHLNHNEIKDVNFVSDIQNGWFMYLDLQNNKIKDLKPFVNLHKKTHPIYINLHNNKISDVSPLTNLFIEHLDLSDNLIENIGHIKTRHLTDLFIQDNKISNLNLLLSNFLKTGTYCTIQCNDNKMTKSYIESLTIPENVTIHFE